MYLTGSIMGYYFTNVSYGEGPNSGTQLFSLIQGLAGFFVSYFILKVTLKNISSILLKSTLFYSALFLIGFLILQWASSQRYYHLF